MVGSQIQSRSSLRSNPNHLTENQSQHKNSSTTIPNIKLEVDEQKRGLSSIAARPYTVPARSNQRRSDGRTSHISAAAPQPHFEALNSSATDVEDTQLKRSATVSRHNGSDTLVRTQIKKERSWKKVVSSVKGKE
ncbi:hypothetical protein DID88_010046 [Monilinia fructigena]|uniref:Uncharacterized protein n=1 Tax=Monilinia fructigena TaxID=38457 RepID=A0A395IN04_9HELO|nr:hypothetical protein DID88_010046 [Monilinia fructigena]